MIAARWHTGALVLVGRGRTQQAFGLVATVPHSGARVATFSVSMMVRNARPALLGCLARFGGLPESCLRHRRLDRRLRAPVGPARQHAEVAGARALRMREVGLRPRRLTSLQAAAVVGLPNRRRGARRRRRRVDADGSASTVPRGPGGPRSHPGLVDGQVPSIQPGKAPRDQTQGEHPERQGYTTPVQLVNWAWLPETSGWRFPVTVTPPTLAK